MTAGCLCVDLCPLSVRMSVLGMFSCLHFFTYGILIEEEEEEKKKKSGGVVLRERQRQTERQGCCGKMKLNEPERQNLWQRSGSLLHPYSDLL